MRRYGWNALSQRLVPRIEARVRLASGKRVC